MSRILILKDNDQNKIVDIRVLSETDNIKYVVVEDAPVIEEREGYTGQYVYIDGKLSVEYVKTGLTCKEKKIQESKELLADWLSNNPIFSTVHNANGEYYTVTQEKQSQLTQMITLAQLAMSNGSSFKTTWNSTSGVCEDWTIEELTMLSFEIAQYVLPRVKKQQLYEVQIRESTEEEVESIEIDYATI